MSLNKRASTNEGRALAGPHSVGSSGGGVAGLGDGISCKASTTPPASPSIPAVALMTHAPPAARSGGVIGKCAGPSPAEAFRQSAHACLRTPVCLSACCIARVRPCYWSCGVLTPRADLADSTLDMQAQDRGRASANIGMQHMCSCSDAASCPARCISCDAWRGLSQLVYNQCPASRDSPLGLAWRMRDAHTRRCQVQVRD